MKNHIFNTKVILSVGAVFTTLLLAFALNAYNQAYSLNRFFLPDAQLAVFLAPDCKSAHEVILEKIINLDGVEKADYIPKEKVLEKAQAENSKLKNIVLSGENPFSPYYIVTPKQVSVLSAKKLAEKIDKIEGVEEAAFDENLFSAVERTGKFADIYRICGKVAMAAVLLIIAAKFVSRWFKEEADFLGYTYNLLIGVISGVLSAGIFYLVIGKLTRADILRLPAKYVFYFIACGIFSVLFWEND